MREKLRNAQGETLVEVLASVLVCALSVMLLAGAVSASARIDLQAQESDAEYYETLSKAEGQAAGDECTPAASLKVAVTNQDGVREEDFTDLTFYGSERLLSYAMPKPAPGTGGGS